MIRKNVIASGLALLGASFFFAPPVLAGPYTDDLSKCLVSSASADDKNVLVTWMFSAIALNPQVAPMANITPEQRRKINADVARLFERLMTEACRAQTQQAVKYEGNSAIEASFSVLGQVAGRELFANPDVAKGLADMNSIIDQKKLQSVFNEGK